MKLFFLISSVALVVVCVSLLRFWLRKQSEPLVAYHQLCITIMWLGILVTLAALITSCMIPQPAAMWLLIAVGLGIVTGTLIKRKELVRQLSEVRKSDTV